MRDEILLVGPVPPQIGGVEFFIDALLKSSLKEQFVLRHFNISKPKSRSRAQFGSPSGYARSFKRQLDISLISFGYSLFYFLKYLFVIPSRRIGLVHLHSSAYMSFWEKCAYLDVAKLFGKKVVMHIHGSGFDRFLIDSGPLARKAIIRHLLRCDKVVALSDSWRLFFISYIPAEKIAVIENGIDLSLFRDIQPMPDNQPTIIFLGEICARKGIYDLLPALIKVREAIPGLQCKLVGPGELERAQTESGALGLDDCVHFAGPKWGSDKADALAHAWCLVLPSYAEVFPLTLLEAFAAGLPVISSRVGGIPDFVREGENGFLVDPGDREGLAAALTKILSDQSLRKRIAETNRELALKSYDIDKCAAKIEIVYQALLA